MKVVLMILSGIAVSVSMSSISIASNNNSSSSKFAGVALISPQQVAKIDSHFKIDKKLAESIGTLSYTNFSDIMSNEDRKTLSQVRSYWSDSQTGLWRVEEAARTRAITELGIFNTKDTLLNKLDSSAFWKNLYTESLLYVRSYKPYVLYKIYGPKATNQSDLIDEANNNYYCAGVMTNAANNYDNRFSASKQYAELIADTLFDKGPQYKDLGAINNDKATEQIKKGVNDNINLKTKFSSFNSCFNLASNKFNIR